MTGLIVFVGSLVLGAYFLWINERGRNYHKD